MKIQTFNKKLVLTKNTIVDLSRDQMKNALGGESVISCQTYLTCCYTEFKPICPTFDYFTCLAPNCS